jgi:hypothetical protein
MGSLFQRIKRHPLVTTIVVFVTTVVAALSFAENAVGVIERASKVYVEALNWYQGKSIESKELAVFSRVGRDVSRLVADEWVKKITGSPLPRELEDERQKTLTRAKLTLQTVGVSIDLDKINFRATNSSDRIFGPREAHFQHEYNNVRIISDAINLKIGQNQEYIFLLFYYMESISWVARLGVFKGDVVNIWKFDDVSFVRSAFLSMDSYANFLRIPKIPEKEKADIAKYIAEKDGIRTNNAMISYEFRIGAHSK